MTDRDRLRTWASRLQLATMIAVIGLPVALVAAIVLDTPASQLALPMSAQATGGQVLAAKALGLLPMAVLVWALLKMRALFGAYAAGEVLSAVNAGLILRIGRGMVAVAVLTIVIRPVQSVILTLANPPGQHALAISLSSSDLGFLLAGGLLTVIGWAMSEAAAAADENRSFV